MMRFPFNRRGAALALVALALAAPALAGVFARVETPDDAIRIWNVHTGRGGVYVGRIVDREVRAVDLPEFGEIEVTTLRVAVTDKITRRTTDGDEIRVTFLGGADYKTSAQPTDRETAVGVDVALFLMSNPFPDELGDTLWLSGLNAVFPIKTNASGDRVVLGKWHGMPVSRNTHLAEFLDSHRAAFARAVAAPDSGGGK